jgi:RimK family alpha-L-glutamate ligase
MQRFLVAGDLTPTNVRLLDALRNLRLDAALLPIDGVLRRARPGDAVLARLDVRATLDGVDGGIYELERLQQRGVHVLNSGPSLLLAHDKLATALRLEAGSLPHPATALVHEHPPESPAPPAVVKPRFGSWGRDVVLCPTAGDLRRTLRRVRGLAWFRRHGALVQELVPPRGEDLRIVIAGDAVVGAVRRVAREGEWRTNVALGARRVAVVPSAAACELALSAAHLIGADLVGVDLLPTDEGYTVIELNGCVDFTDDYSFKGPGVFVEVARQLVLAVEAADAAGVQAALLDPTPL